MELTDPMSSMSIESYVPRDAVPRDTERALYLPPLPPDTSLLPTSSLQPTVFPLNVPKQTGSFPSAGEHTTAFVSIWTALNQLYGHLNMTKNNDDILSDKTQIVPESLPSNAIGQLLDRGMKSAELSFDLPVYFSKYSFPMTCFDKYKDMRNKVIKSARLVKCPALTSTQWKTLGAVLIDSVVLSVQDITG